MRRTLVLTALSACIAACGNDGGGAVGDSGGAVDNGDAALAEREAGEPNGDQDSGTIVASSDAGGSSGPSDSGSGVDASRPRDGGSEAGAPRDAGTSTSAEAGAGPTGCAGKTYKVCEDFESANVGALPSGWTYSYDMQSNRPAVVTDQFHSGTRSLRSANLAVGQARIAKSLTSLGATAGKHWGRIFYRVKSPPTLPTGGGVLHDTMVALTRASMSFEEWRVVDTIVNSSGKHVFALNVPNDLCCGETGYDYASYDGKWHCAEWYIDVPAQEYRFFFDGTDLKVPAKPSGGQVQQITQVVLGWVSYQTTGAPYNQAWLDDLAIDDNRIGCE